MSDFYFLPVLLPAQHPPYAVIPTSFRFPALAALAGRAPMGGQRELALATYLVARLAQDCTPNRGLAQQVRAERAASARTWLSSTPNLSPAVKQALLRVVEASASDTGTTAQAVRGVIGVTANLLDTHARLELEQLAAALERQTVTG